MWIPSPTVSQADGIWCTEILLPSGLSQSVP